MHVPLGLVIIIVAWGPIVGLMIYNVIKFEQIMKDRQRIIDERHRIIMEKYKRNIDGTPKS